VELQARKTPTAPLLSGHRPEVTADLLAAADKHDAHETGLVAEVELDPGASAT
jgi:hypothetical protein